MTSCRAAACATLVAFSLSAVACAGPSPDPEEPPSTGASVTAGASLPPRGSPSPPGTDEPRTPPSEPVPPPPVEAPQESSRPEADPPQEPAPPESAPRELPAPPATFNALQLVPGGAGEGQLPPQNHIHFTLEYESFLSFTNSSPEEVAVGSAEVVNQTGQGFRLTGDGCAGTVLAPADPTRGVGDTCQVRVQFTAPEPGVYAGQLIFRFPAHNAVQVISLTGEKAEASPTSPATPAHAP